MFERCLDLRRQVGDERGTAGTLGNLAATQARLGRFDDAARSFGELVDHYRAAGDRGGVARALQGLGNVLNDSGQASRAVPLLEESLALFRELGHRRGIVTTLNSLAGNAIDREDLVRALTYTREALSIAREATAQEDIIVGLECRAAIAAIEGDAALAVTLLASVAAARGAIGWTVLALRRPEYERRLEDLRDALGDGAFATAWEMGSLLSLHDATARALRDEPHDERATEQTLAPVRPAASPLTRREREIAVLIAQGLNNRAIAERLVISKRTADTHVTNILNRLGFSARAQVAVWAVEHGLIGAPPE
jgi:DNA-binding CsgD family transcriptional regulator